MTTLGLKQKCGRMNVNPIKMKKIYVYILGGILVAGVGVLAYQRINSSTGSKPTQLPVLTKEIKLEPGRPVCDQIPANVVEGILGEKVERIEDLSEEPFGICRYWFKDNDFLSISTGNFSYDEQKQNRQNLGRQIKTNPAIAVEHFIGMDDNGRVSDVVLKISDNYFLAIEFFNLKSMHFRKATSEETVVAFVANLVNYLQTGKINKIKINLSETVETIPQSSPATHVIVLPEDRDFINRFFGLINQKKAEESVELLTLSNIKTEEMKAMWQQQFEAIQSVKVLSIEPVKEDAWTDQKHEYKVILDMVMDEASKNAPIPYYGYDQGESTRFITLVKEGDNWLIEAIATGP